MEISEKIKDELDLRLKKVENFVSDLEIKSKLENINFDKINFDKIGGSRNANIAFLVGGLVAITGLTLLALSSKSEEEED